MKQMKGLMVAVAVASCGALVGAQSRSLPSLGAQAPGSGPRLQLANAKDSAPLSTESCAYSFSVAGPQNSFLKYCVTVNGNIVSFNSPNGIDQIMQGGFAEGYGICDFSSGARYFDYAYTDSGNWNGPILNTLTAAVVKITRSTNDGVWTLTQTISKVSGPSPYAKVTMALKNNTSGARDAYLVRYADVDPADASSNGFAENFDSTVFSAFGWESLNSGRPSYGMAITELGNPAPGSTSFGWEGLDQATSAGPDPCGPAYAGLATGVDGSVVMLWGVQLNAHQTSTVNAKYHVF
jgi:hypothetical protein